MIAEVMENNAKEHTKPSPSSEGAGEKKKILCKICNASTLIRKASKANNVNVCAEYECVLFSLFCRRLHCFCCRRPVRCCYFVFSLFPLKQNQPCNNIKSVHMDGTFKTPKTNRSRIKTLLTILQLLLKRHMYSNEQ